MKFSDVRHRFGEVQRAVAFRCDWRSKHYPEVEAPSGLYQMSAASEANLIAHQCPVRWCTIQDLAYIPEGIANIL